MKKQTDYEKFKAAHPEELKRAADDLAADERSAAIAEFVAAWDALREWLGEHATDGHFIDREYRVRVARVDAARERLR